LRFQPTVALAVLAPRAADVRPARHEFAQRRDGLTPVPPLGGRGWIKLIHMTVWRDLQEQAATLRSQQAVTPRSSQSAQPHRQRLQTLVWIEVRFPVERCGISLV